MGGGSWSGDMAVVTVGCLPASGSRANDLSSRHYRSSNSPVAVATRYSELPYLPYVGFLSSVIRVQFTIMMFPSFQYVSAQMFRKSDEINE